LQFVINPILIFYATGIVCIFSIWLLWKIFKAINSIDASIKEIAKNLQKPQS